MEGAVPPPEEEGKHTGNGRVPLPRGEEESGALR